MTPIFVPSRSRMERLGTLEELQPVMDRVTLVVPEGQADDYLEALRLMDIEHKPRIEGVPDHYRIGETRLYCGRRARELGARRFAMIDDDIGFLVRKTEMEWNLRPTTREEIVEMFDYVDRYMDDHPATTLFGISPREGNNTIGTGDRDTLVDVGARIYRTYWWDTAEFLSLRHGRGVIVAEDLELSLQSLRRGNLNAMSFWYAQGQGDTQDPGGASDYRTLEVHNASVLRFKELHPEYVEVVQSRKKGGGDIGHRLETRIAWKRAIGL